jgi:hypothetical protein
MEWRHYEVRATGTVTVANDSGAILGATYTMGIVSTGKARVFAGHFVSVTLNTGTELSAEDEHSVVAALRKLASHLAVVNLDLRCVGLDSGWTESGLSYNTGWGYLGKDQAAIFMMDDPTSHTDDEVDRMIAEALAGMRIGQGRK